MADQTSLHNRVIELESQVQRMMELLGQAPESPPVALFPLVDTLHSRVETLQKVMGEWLDMSDKRVTSAIEETSIFTNAIDVRVDGVQAEPFGGARSAKELENFLWDMEMYFQEARILEAEKVSITSMYLIGDAKLRWRTRLSEDVSANRDKIETWDVLKKELKDQFLPCNTSWLAREFLQKLKHAGTTWAQTELRRQGVKDLLSAIATTDRLVDFRVANSSDPEKKKKDSGKKRRNLASDGGMESLRKRKTRRLNPLQLVSAMQERPPKQKGLMYVRVQINGKAVMAMLDSSATHNFVADREIQKLGLTLAQHSSRIKTVNSEAKPIQGVACEELKVGAWTGKCNLMVVPLDDFDVIIGVDFMLLANTMVMPYLNGLFIADQNSTCFVQGTYLQDSVRSAEKKDSLMSAMQVKAGLRHGEQTYLAALIEIKPDVVQEVPDEVAELLQEFKDVFPPELPKKLPPRRAIDHAIELEPSARPPAKASYRMDPAELAELRKQLVWRPGWSSHPKHHMVLLFYSKGSKMIDLRSGYWQIRVARGDEPKTTCDQPRKDSDGPKKGISEIVNPLEDLLRKYQKWEWNVAYDDVLRSLKQAISSQSVLKLPQFDKPFEVQVDASDRALGGVLVQDKHPVAFESRKLKDAELRYSTHEKEMTIEIHCLEEWRHYLLGIKFNVVTDNVANTYFKMQRKLSPKQARWQEFLGEFDFEWVHRPSKHNNMADALSRKLVKEYVAALTVVKSDFLNQIWKSSKTDEGYLKLVEQVKSGLIRKYWFDSGLLYAKGG
ncbi:UNVERIFIED_CONTAM: hypothetical protein Sangu_3037600 [Sesamum angustifolium]|uniref:Reverse transcriptase RNase H-like domain-containing protein n=1 Tax=Sesamum angustifolium TaxID=2727405 RepID=A0AAW2KEC5_9LAMI